MALQELTVSCCGGGGGSSAAMAAARVPLRLAPPRPPPSIAPSVPAAGCCQAAAGLLMKACGDACCALGSGRCSTRPKLRRAHGCLRRRLLQQGLDGATAADAACCSCWCRAGCCGKDKAALVQQVQGWAAAALLPPRREPWDGAAQWERQRHIDVFRPPAARARTPCPAESGRQGSERRPALFLVSSSLSNDEIEGGQLTKLDKGTERENGRNEHCCPAAGRAGTRETAHVGRWQIIFGRNVWRAMSSCSDGHDQGELPYMANMAKCCIS